MSLEHNDKNRKALKRRVQEMAKAAKIVGPQVRQVAIRDGSPEKKVELAKLLAANVLKPGLLGQIMGTLVTENENGYRGRVVREGSVKATIEKMCAEAPNLMEGWSLDALAFYMGVAKNDDRLRKRTAAMTKAFEKMDVAAGSYQGFFKVLTITELAITQERDRKIAEGQIKARARKSKPLRVRGIEPTGKQNLQLAWWDLPQMRQLEGGTQ